MAAPPRKATSNSTSTSAAADVKAENKRLEVQFKAQHGLLVAFFTLILSHCATPPTAPLNNYAPGSIERGCWHPKSFDKAVVIVIDALRYDFTIPFKPRPGDESAHHFHNAFPVLHERSVSEPANAFLLPFIADPPTTTLQRLKGLTTGSLPTLIDAGSNFAGTAIDEDNLVEQLFNAGKRVVHLGDDTWHSLFPGYFEPNLTKAYDSFNVWDLHTVDNGVNENLFPLLAPDMRNRWDVIFAHYLGVDHAGHRYGPDHPAMAEKLKQMNEVLQDVIASIDDKTLLVVLGDHGMDVKGDHGGESDDEVEAALWMYSKAGIFGRSNPALIQPPASAKERPVRQIDLVPTLALLLGLPVPFNNLGQPIEEAFIGKAGKDQRNLASVSHITAAQIHKYQEEYAAVRRLDDKIWSTATSLWSTAQTVLTGVQTARPSAAAWKDLYDAYKAYQTENLSICKSMWARFDLVSMGLGIAVLLATFLLVAVYAQGVVKDHAALAPLLVRSGAAGSAVGVVSAAAFALSTATSLLTSCAFGAAMGGIAGIFLGLWSHRSDIQLPYPRTVWGVLSSAVCLMLCIGFAANSFTIWEDQQLLFFLTTFALLMLASSLGQADTQDRLVGTLNSVSFLAATRLSSLSRLCREEQMPFCRSSYYASANSSTSATWQLVIPFAVAAALPTIIASFYYRTRNYQGSGVIWIGIALRIGLALVAVFWVIDVADDGDWFPSMSKDLLKTCRVLVAQAVLALAFAAGISTFVYASPLIAVKQEAVTAEPSSTSKPVDSAKPGGPILTTINSTPQPRSKLIIMGYANTHGTRYFLLPCAWILALQLLQKPMGQGALALCMVSILNLLEIIDANSLHNSAAGPTVLALLGSFYFFKTGHQATLASLQWDSAFIALKTIQYPFTPILVTLNTCGAQILCALAVPAIPLWKIKPRAGGLLSRVAAAMSTHVLFYAAITLATVIEAAWLRRHLMLYRIFMPRMLLSSVVILVVDFIAAMVALMGARWSIVSVGEVFGWM